VIGDWNAKVGTDNVGWEHVMGCHAMDSAMIEGNDHWNYNWQRCTLQLAKTKREMKQRRQESEESEKEYRVMCNMVKKAARTDKEE